jgi:hypothetical protein
MTSLMQSLTGRKRDSNVWRYFQYLDDKKKSKCLITDVKAKPCGFEVAGKNPTNLKMHLHSHHRELYAQFCDKEDERKKAVKRQREEEDASNTLIGGSSQGRGQTLFECVNRRTATWSKDSLEYKYRLDGILQMLVSSGCPVTMVDEDDYRESMRRLDPKFVIPGI